ncbi:hypothetical protein [Halostella sp. PRR32]|uniref:hypothetical protein n=1 Tax=Halostella sp. PRR32 TaxID=3098147 RepID=UPI002B1CF42A|nr:hypothetical protein [Halostella sp. PRR32]
MATSETLLLSGGVSLAVSFLVSEYRVRRQSTKDEKQEANQWHRELNEELSRLKHYCQKQLTSSDIGFKQVAEEHEAVSDELARIAGRAPSGVSIAAVREVESLSGKLYSQAENIEAFDADNPSDAREFMEEAVSEFNTHVGDTVDGSEFSFLEEMDDWETGRHLFSKTLLKLTQQEIDAHRSRLSEFRQE